MKVKALKWGALCWIKIHQDAQEKALAAVDGLHIGRPCSYYQRRAHWWLRRAARYPGDTLRRAL
jgi:hypothetical protein